MSDDLGDALDAARVTSGELGDALAAARGDNGLPALELYELRLHRHGRPWDTLPGDVEWDAIAVGIPAPFHAEVVRGRGLWRPVESATVVAPEDLEDPGWTIRPVGRAGEPTMNGRVGHGLRRGEGFTRSAEPGWTANVGELSVLPGATDRLSLRDWAGALPTATIVPSVVAVLDREAERVDDLVGRLDDETVDELWAALVEAARELPTPGTLSVEEEWRLLSGVLTRTDVEQIVQAATDHIRDDIQTLGEELRRSVTALPERIAPPTRSTIKRIGAILVLLAASFVTGGGVGYGAASGNPDVVLTSVIAGIFGLPALYDRIPR